MRPVEEQLQRFDTIDGIDRVEAQSVVAGLGPAMRRTARLADVGGISPGWTPGLVEEKLQLHRQSRQKHGREDQVNDLILRRNVHLKIKPKRGNLSSSSARKSCRTLTNRQ
ncbi:MAG: hypothetical protein OEU26_01415 [Candidatus Tectomicrobia bacterium]|nr:hypothetical protein [Candidatus Tectomicrobia bacterium]